MAANSDPTVLLLHITLKYDIEHAARDMSAFNASLKRWAKRVQHGSRFLAIAIVTEESPDDLRRRLASTLDAMSVLDDFWVAPAPKADDVVGRLGNFSPFNHYLREAWVEAVKRRKPQNLRRFERRQR